MSANTPDSWSSACFPSLREVCPPNCLEGSVASQEAVNPILKAMGYHLTSAITRFNHKLLSHLKNIRIIIFSLLEKQTNPVNTLICCWMGNRFYGFFLFEYLFFWAEQLHFSPKPMSGENYKVKLYAYLHTYKLAFIVAEYNFKWHFEIKLLGGWILWDSVRVGSKTPKSTLPAFSNFILYEWKVSLTGFESYSHCVLFFCESVVGLIDVIPSACEVTNLS